MFVHVLMHPLRWLEHFEGDVSVGCECDAGSALHRARSHCHTAAGLSVLFYGCANNPFIIQHERDQQTCVGSSKGEKPG